MLYDTVNVTGRKSWHEGILAIVARDKQEVSFLFSCLYENDCGISGNVYWGFCYHMKDSSHFIKNRHTKRNIYMLVECKH